MATIKSTDENFENLLKENKVLITDFWAEWGGHCKQIGPALEEISNEMTNVIVAKHNIDEEPNYAVKFGVRGIPTMILFVDGKQKSVKVGATTKSNIVSWIKDNI